MTTIREALDDVTVRSLDQLKSDLASVSDEELRLSVRERAARRGARLHMAWAVRAERDMVRSRFIFGDECQRLAAIAEGGASIAAAYEFCRSAFDSRVLYLEHDPVHTPVQTHGTVVLRDADQNVIATYGSELRAMLDEFTPVTKKQAERAKWACGPRYSDEYRRGVIESGRNYDVPSALVSEMGRTLTSGVYAVRLSQQDDCPNGCYRNVKRGDPWCECEKPRRWTVWIARFSHYETGKSGFRFPVYIPAMLKTFTNETSAIDLFERAKMALSNDTLAAHPNDHHFTPGEAQPYADPAQLLEPDDADPHDFDDWYPERGDSESNEQMALAAARYEAPDLSGRAPATRRPGPRRL